MKISDKIANEMLIPTA